MENIYKITHFDREKQPKSLQISINRPVVTDRGYPKAGDIVLGIMTKEKSLGFGMSTGDVSDLVRVLTSLREELLNGLVSLKRENAREQDRKSD